MKALTFSSNYYPTMLRRYNADTTEHEMTILLDQGLYRHLRFKKPGTGMYWFDIITWPGTLTIRGDMGNYVFAREEDMFTWFDLYHVNADYWAEKLMAIDRQSQPREFSEQLFKQWLLQDFWERRHQYSEHDAAEIWTDIRSGILDDYEDRSTALVCQYLLNGFHSNGYQYEDTWEHTWQEYTAQYLWCCHAIIAAIRDYREVKTAVTP